MSLSLPPAFNLLSIVHLWPVIFCARTASRSLGCWFCATLDAPVKCPHFVPPGRPLEVQTSKKSIFIGIAFCYPDLYKRVIYLQSQIFQQLLGTNYIRYTFQLLFHIICYHTEAKSCSFPYIHSLGLSYLLWLNCSPKFICKILTP